MVYVTLRHIPCLPSQLKNLKEGEDWCGQVLEVDPEAIDALCDRAELYISHQMYEEAVNDYQTASSVEEHPSKVCNTSSHLPPLLASNSSMYMYLFSFFLCI